ncbi:MAG TPA: 2-hydroxyacyl-CoA dehydratase family protein [Spirochaetota bacterium]|nr:2-hydroxyacyl-CoA dehydratase family protein [Spirochaetota bacterium]HPJ38967.1 2-hydroxyacyl-CoA dehydratase family protein [Spirochaetota bacterium]
MNPVFTEVTEAQYNRYVKEWKEQGKPVAGYTCSFVPEEVFHAAGILPFRIRGFSARETTIGDTYFGPFICSLPKCMLQCAGQGDLRFLDGTVIVPGCDSMRRLDECWRKAGVDIEGILPEFFFHFSVPHKHTDYTVRWFAEEIQRLIAAVENHFGVHIGEEDLRKSIKVYNRTRELVTEFEMLRTRDDPACTGAEALSVLLAGTAMPREEYNALLEEYIAEAGNAPGISGKTRLLLGGSACDDIDLVTLVEGAGALVVADNVCFGSRFFEDRTGEDGDPIEELALRYLGQNLCPRMYGDYDRRLSLLLERAAKAKVQGVILQNIRFCDLHGSENGLLEREFESRGIPCMRIEREYGPLVETGRLKMRIDAFQERIQQGKVRV